MLYRIGLVLLLLLLSLPAYAYHTETQTPYDSSISINSNDGSITVSWQESDGYEDNPPEYYIVYIGLTESADDVSIQTTFGFTEALTWRSHTFTAEYLYTNLSVDNQKIYAAGWSLGGTAALFNGWMPLQASLNKNGASFAGYLMWYPGCLALPDLNEWDKDLMQIYIGEEDNWTPPQPCRELVADINSQGGNAFIEIYPNSFHSFDGPQPLRLIPDAYSWAECKLKLNAETMKVYDPSDTLLDFSDPKLRRAAYESCAKKGEVMAGASPEYKNAAHDHLATLLPKLD